MIEDERSEDGEKNEVYPEGGGKNEERTERVRKLRLLF